MFTLPLSATTLRLLALIVAFPDCTIESTVKVAFPAVIPLLLDCVYAVPVTTYAPEPSVTSPAMPTVPVCAMFALPAVIEPVLASVKFTPLLEKVPV